MNAQTATVTGGAIAIALVLSALAIARHHGTAYRIPHLPAARVETPASTVERPGDAGLRGHSNVEIFVPGALGPLEPPPQDFYRTENPRAPLRSSPPATQNQK